MHDWTSTRCQLRYVDLCLNVLLLIESLREWGLKHVARVLRALILQELGGKLSPAVEFSRAEVPVKLWQVEEQFDVLPHFGISLGQWIILRGLRVNIVLDLDKRRVIKVHPVVDQRLRVEKYDEVLFTEIVRKVAIVVSDELVVNRTVLFLIAALYRAAALKLFDLVAGAVVRGRWNVFSEGRGVCPDSACTTVGAPISRWCRHRLSNLRAEKGGRPIRRHFMIHHLL